MVSLFRTRFGVWRFGLGTSFVRQESDIQCFVLFPSSPTTGKLYRLVSKFFNSPENWAENTYLLTSKPRVRPKSVIEQATAFFSTAVTSSKSLLSGVGHNKATPDQVFDNGDIDLLDDEILDLDRSEEGEVDDSPDLLRFVRVVTVSPTDYDKTVTPYKALRRKWELLPLRATRAQYHGRKSSTSD